MYVCFDRRKSPARGRCWRRHRWCHLFAALVGAEVVVWALVQPLLPLLAGANFYQEGCQHLDIMVDILEMQ